MQSLILFLLCWLWQVTVVSDDTNVWVNNPSKKRAISETGYASASVKTVKGIKRVQTLLGILQTLVIRRSSSGSDGAASIAHVHAPCQLLPRANAWTILSRLRRWSLYSAVGCAEHFGGGQLRKVFESVPLKLVLHCHLDSVQCSKCQTSIVYCLLIR